MKIFALTLGVLLLCSTASAQKVQMQIIMNDGSVLRMNTDSITSMSVTPIEYPNLRIMHLSRVTEIDGELAVNSTYMDSLHFVRNANGMKLVFKSDYQYYIAPVSGVNGSSIVDTIKFGLYSFNTSVTNISRLDEPNPKQLISSDWHGSNIYASYPMRRYKVNNDYEVIQDSVFGWEGNFPLNIEINNAQDRMVYSIPTTEHFMGGRLVEHNLAAGTFDTLDVGSQITAARYLNSSNDLIYYSLGSYDYDHNPNPDDAGYYLLDRSTGDTTFLLKHLPAHVEDDIVNGFDVNHSGTKFLYSKVDGLERAILMEFDLQTKKTEILPVDFPKVFARTLWVQYSNDDSRILYSLSDITPIPSLVGVSSEVGIINRSNYIRQVLDVAPHTMRGFLVPYPRWSPDNTAICYGAAMFPYLVRDHLEPFNIYVKKL